MRLSTAGPKLEVLVRELVLAGRDERISVVFLERMHFSTSVAFEEASPQLSLVVDLNQFEAASAALVWPKPLTVPDSWMRPATIGSSAYAYE